MVRKGSTVRVRQRALKNPANAHTTRIDLRRYRLNTTEKGSKLTHCATHRDVSRRLLTQPSGPVTIAPIEEIPAKRTMTERAPDIDNSRLAIEPNRSPTRAADAATRSPYAARTKSPAAQPDHPTACDPDSERAAPSSAAVARTAPTTHPRRSTARRTPSVSVVKAGRGADGCCVRERVPSFRFEF